MANRIGLLGGWLDFYTPETSRLLRALKPNFAVVGEGAWYQIPQIQADMASDPLLILRWVASDNYTPENVARTIAYSASLYSGRFAGYGLNEPDVNSAQARQKLVDWELAFINECHYLNLPTVCLNLATGNPPGDTPEMLQAMEELRPVHDASDYIGLHLYDLVHESILIDRLYAAFRYKLWPDWFNRSKLLSTEVGIDGIGQRLGWRDWSSQQDMIIRMEFLADSWRQDGILGGAFFHLGAMNSEWDSYLASEKLMATLSMYNKDNHNDGYVSLPEVTDVPRTEFVLGVKDEADRLRFSGVDVGMALENEDYFLPNLAIQTTSKGFFFIRKFPDDTFEVQFHPKA